MSVSVRLGIAILARLHAPAVFGGIRPAARAHMCARVHDHVRPRPTRPLSKRRTLERASSGTIAHGDGFDAGSPWTPASGTPVRLRGDGLGLILRTAKRSRPRDRRELQPAL